MEKVETSECALHSRNLLPREGSALKFGLCLRKKGCRLAAYLSHCLIPRKIFTGSFCTSCQFSEYKQTTNVPQKLLLNSRRWFAIFEGSSWLDILLTWTTGKTHETTAFAFYGPVIHYYKRILLNPANILCTHFNVFNSDSLWAWQPEDRIPFLFWASREYFIIHEIRRINYTFTDTCGFHSLTKIKDQLTWGLL